MIPNRVFVVEGGFSANVSDPVVRWTDITEYCTKITTQRGRNTELDKIETGTATFSFDNTDGRFTPGRNTIPVLTEHFSNLGGLGANSTFAVDSGLWQHNSGNTNVRTVTTSSDGLTVSADNVAAGGFLEIKRLAAQAIPVTAGDRIMVSYRARVRNSVSLATVRSSALFNSGGALATSVSGTVQTSNGQWVKFMDTYTVPVHTPAIDGFRVDISASPATGVASGPLELDVSSVRVTVPSPYGNGIRTRRPLRAYNRFDDNYLHAECVSVDLADLDAPRFTPQPVPGDDLTQPGLEAYLAAWQRVVKVSDATLGQNVFEFGDIVPDAIAPVPFEFRSGPDGDADAIYVNAGQTVTVDADLANMTPGSSAGVAVGFEFWTMANPTATPVATMSSLATGIGVYTHKAISYTPTEDGYVRVRMKGALSTPDKGTSCWRAANLKVRLNRVGLATPAAVSGVVPTFRGYVEKWESTYTGNIPTVDASVVDALSVLNIPISSAYRDLISRYVERSPNLDVQYWSCTDGPGAAFAQPLFGSNQLHRELTSTAPQAADFTSDKTMVFQDGADSGGFTVSEDPSVNNTGAVLTLNKFSKPVLLANPSYWAASMWFTTPQMPVAGFPYTLFNALRSDASTIASFQVYNDGSGQAITAQGGAVPGWLGLSAMIPAGVFVAGHVYRVTVELTHQLDTFVWDDTLGVGYQASNTGAVTIDHPSFTQFGGQLWGSLASGFFRGTLNHIMVVTGHIAPPTIFDPAQRNQTIENFLSAVRFPGDLDADLAAETFIGQQGEADRIRRILAAARWPGSSFLDRSLSMLLEPRWDDQSSTLDLLTAVGESTSGTVLVGTAGELQYQSRQRRMGAPYRWTLNEWTDGLNFWLDDNTIYNVITVNRSTGLTRTVTDPASISAFGAKTLPSTPVIDVVDDDEVTQAANWLLHRYSEGSAQCDTIIIDASGLNGPNDAQLELMAYSATVSDKILFDDLPDTAPADSLDFFAEGVGMDIELDNGTVNTWVTTLTVSDAGRSACWILEDPISGVLNSEDCVLAY